MKSAIRRVSLKRAEVEYLKATNLLPPPLMACLDNVTWQSDVAGALDVTPATAEEFRQLLTERLASVGFDREYEPTDEGVLLEELIDRFEG